MLTFQKWARSFAMMVYSMRRAQKRERKRNPQLKHNALADMLKGKTVYPPGTVLRIRLPEDFRLLNK
jgi:hypothetical protein